MQFPWKFFRGSALANDRLIFDSHCHLNSPEMIDKVEMYLFNAVKGNVRKFLIVGYDFNSSVTAVRLAKQYDYCYAAVGFQPEELKKVNNQTMKDLFGTYLDHTRIVAIGEIGLDYHYIKDEDERAKQREIFIHQIEVANEHNLPIVVHCRDAFEDCLNILKEHTPSQGGVMHCFSGSAEMMNEFIKLGMYISLAGPVTFSNAKEPKEIAKVVPIDKLLVETDSPYLAPNPVRGTMNEPNNINYTIEVIARLRGCNKEEIEKATYENACRLFHV